MKKTILIFVLLASMLFGAGCGDTAAGGEKPAQNGPASEIETTAAAPETERPYYDAKGADYDGATFVIWNFDNAASNGWTGIPNDLFVDEMNGDVLNDAVYTRNLEVENRLNFSIEGADKTDALMRAVISMMLAGDHGVDLLFPRHYYVPALVDGSAVIDLLTLDAFDFSEPWWNQNCNATLTMRGKLFCAASDANYYDKLSTIVVFYNQQLVDNYTLGNLYGVVEDGSWTLDKAIELGGLVTADLDGNGVYDDKDSIGISCQNDGPYYLLNGFGITICSTDEQGDVFLNLKSEKAVNTLQAIYKLTTDPMLYFNRQTFNLSLTDAINIFKDNRTLFMIRPLQSLFIMRDMDSDFGIIPLPKYNERQDEYCSAVNPYVGTIAMIPRTAEDPGRSAVVLSTLACESHYSVISKLYETVLGEKLIRDEESGRMLDHAFAGIVFDAGVIWDFGSILETLLANKSTDVSSMLASVSDAVDGAIGKLNETLDAMG